MERDQSDTDAIRTQIRWGRMFREREGLTPCTSSVRVSCTPIVFSADLQVVFAMLLILARPSAPLWQTGGGCCRCALLACHTGPQTRIAARVAGSVWCVCGADLLPQSRLLQVVARDCSIWQVGVLARTRAASAARGAPMPARGWALLGEGLFAPTSTTWLVQASVQSRASVELVFGA